MQPVGAHAICSHPRPRRMLSIKVPPLGESIVEATISRWLKQEGDPVASGETLVELETDKVTVEVPALKAGVLTRRLKQEGDVVTVGAELAQIDDTASASANGDAKPGPATAESVPPPRPTPVPVP